MSDDKDSQHSPMEILLPNVNNGGSTNGEIHLMGEQPQTPPREKAPYKPKPEGDDTPQWLWDKYQNPEY